MFNRVEYMRKYMAEWRRKNPDKVKTQRRREGDVKIVRRISKKKRLARSYENIRNRHLEWVRKNILEEVT